jgi:ABC-2 type transport system ATP-binding protein
MPTNVIEVEGLRKTYPDGTEAVRDISFSVEEGEFFGFLGPNGAGKSTTIKVLITLLGATAGSARIFDHDIRTEATMIRTLIGYAAQEVGVDDELTGRENLWVQGRLYHLGSAVLNKRIDDLLDLVDLGADADRPAGSYSGGMRKRLDLATGLIHRPQLLFLDEPTTGLDPQNRAGIWTYLEDLNKREGMSIFLTTHYLEEADKLCDRLAIIDHGSIIARGSPADLKGELGGDMISLAFQTNGTSAADQQAKATEIVSAMPFVDNIRDDNGKLVMTAQQGGQSLPQILRALDAAGIDVADLSMTSPTLDDVFLKYTGERIREDTPVQNWRNARMPFMRPTRRRG